MNNKTNTTTNELVLQAEKDYLEAKTEYEKAYAHFQTITDEDELAELDKSLSKLEQEYEYYDDLYRYLQEADKGDYGELAERYDHLSYYAESNVQEDGKQLYNLIMSKLPVFLNIAFRIVAKMIIAFCKLSIIALVGFL